MDKLKKGHALVCMVVIMNNVVVEVIGARNDYKVQFETWEDAEKYCDENKYYFNNASVFITQGF